MSGTPILRIRLLALTICLFILGGLFGFNRLNPAQSAAATTTATTPTQPAVTTATAVPSITPTQNAVYSDKATVLFPSLVRFVLYIHVKASDVQSAQLKLIQGTTLSTALDIPVKDTIHYLSDTDSFFDYAWPLTEQTEPTPFQSVDYSWTITMKSGPAIKSGGTFDYQDNNFQWKNTALDPLHMYSHDEGLSLELLQQSVLKAYNLIAQNTGIQHVFNLIIYDSNDQFCQTDPTHPKQPVVIDPYDKVEFPCDPTLTPKLYAARGFSFLQRQTPLFEQLIDQVIGVIAGDAYDSIWKSASSPPPAWFRSGLIQFYSLIGHPSALLLTRDASRNDQLLTLDQLAVPPTPKPNDFGATVRAYDAQSYMLTIYLAEKFGANAPFKIAQQIGQNNTFDSALAAVGNGATMADLYNSWKDWLFTDDADSAVQWDPYILTPTATRTPTATDFPTLTPTSDQPTATDTEFTLPSLTPTPVPPTATATLTNTPLPPGSLNKPSAIPTS